MFSGGWFSMKMTLDKRRSVGYLSETAVLDASADKNETDARLLVLEQSRRIQQDVEPLHDAHGAREHGDEAVLHSQPAGQRFVPRAPASCVLHCTNCRRRKRATRRRLCAQARSSFRSTKRSDRSARSINRTAPPVKGSQKKTVVQHSGIGDRVGP